MDDFKSVFNNPDSHEFLAIVSAVHHEGRSQTLHNGALSFAEPFYLVTACRVRQVLGVFFLACDIILQFTVIHNKLLKTLLSRIHLFSF